MPNAKTQMHWYGSFAFCWSCHGCEMHWYGRGGRFRGVSSSRLTWHDCDTPCHSRGQVSDL
ncbi:hypothetical protein TSUD_163860 [Trifolium subterraneum]|uniref:Uncharacterized protein n=1 Tax=Trifolium subterraneum TaxID=3900 RepID=A0A2Z6N510_TRISU|nr:hypothetical protein TSUD_163860 [Trifolium subterraneum]